MICVLSLIVFGILGVFSVKHRELAKEAFNCVKNRAKRQPCDTMLDERVQASVVGKVLDHSPRAAQTLNRYFSVFSWIALILLVVSGLSVGLGTYNYVVHGNCNGPNSDEGCAANSIEEKLNKLSEDNGALNKTPEVSPENSSEEVPG